MKNQTMKERLESGEAFDVSKCERNRDGDYLLPRRMHPPKRKEPKDYCDSSAEIWIHSIGGNKQSGRVVASASGKFYQRKGWECLWLR